MDESDYMKISPSGNGVNLEIFARLEITSGTTLVAVNGDDRYVIMHGRVTAKGVDGI